MTQTITNYTTYDMDTYYTDIKWLPRLSATEEQHLLATLAHATPTADIRQRLIEAHLGLAIHMARELRPVRNPHLFPDLVQAANLALVEATSRFDFGSDGDYLAYILAWMRGRVKRALCEDVLLKPDAATRQQAREAGTLDELYHRVRPLSLDLLLDADDPDSSVLDHLQTPPQETPAPSSRDTHKQEQVDTLLGYLCPRAQTILRLRYGLLEDDERPHSIIEIGRLLGLSRNMVYRTEQDALRRLRAFVRGEAHLVTRNGRLCISLPGSRQPTLSPAREAVLTEAARQLESTGQKLTARLLAHTSGTSQGVAALFLRKWRGKPESMAHSQAVRQQEREQRLEAAYGQVVEATSVPPSGNLLAQLAHVARPTARAFLRTRQEVHHAA